MDFENSKAQLNTDLIQLEIEEHKQFLERIEEYEFEKEEEHRKRFDRHLGELKSSKKKAEEQKAIEDRQRVQDELEYVEKENTNSEDPNIQEEAIDTKAATDDGEKEGRKFIIHSQSTGEKEKIENVTESLREDEYFPETTIFNLATNIIFKLLQHPSYDLVQYGVSKITSMIKLNIPELDPRSANIFKLFTVCLKLKFKERKNMNTLQKSLIKQLLDGKRDSTIQINLGSANSFYEFLNTFRSLYDSYLLEIRQESVKLLKFYIEDYVEFLATNKEQKQAILKQNNFLGPIFKDLFGLISLNDDDIRQIATDCLLIIVDEFLPPPPIVKGVMYEDDIKDFKDNLSAAFDSDDKMERMEQY